MENRLIPMIIVATTFVVAAILFAVYGWKLSKQFPKIIKAKVKRIETLEDGKFRYHFEGRNDGRRIMEDVVTYKEKKWKVGEKVDVRMNTQGNKCHSNFPIWPIASTVACVLLALIIPLAFFAGDVEHDHDHDHLEDSVAENETSGVHDHDHEEVGSVLSEDGHEHVDGEDEHNSEENETDGSETDKAVSDEPNEEP